MSIAHSAIAFEGRERGRERGGTRGEGEGEGSPFLVREALGCSVIPVVWGEQEKGMGTS